MPKKLKQKRGYTRYVRGKKQGVGPHTQHYHYSSLRKALDLTEEYTGYKYYPGRKKGERERFLVPTAEEVQREFRKQKLEPERFKEYAAYRRAVKKALTDPRMTLVTTDKGRIISFKSSRPEHIHTEILRRSGKTFKQFQKKLDTVGGRGEKHYTPYQLVIVNELEKQIQTNPFLTEQARSRLLGRISARKEEDIKREKLDLPGTSLELIEEGKKEWAAQRRMFMKKPTTAGKPKAKIVAKEPAKVTFIESKPKVTFTEKKPEVVVTFEQPTVEVISKKHTVEEF